MEKIVVFELDDLKYALPLGAVIRVIHAVEIRSLPKVPEIISGIINVGGKIIPVIDVRKRFGLNSREIESDDQLVIANTGKREVALLIDNVTGIQDVAPNQQSDTGITMPFAGYIRGIVKMEDELILIYDLEQFLDLDEENQLEQALSKKGK